MTRVRRSSVRRALVALLCGACLYVALVAGAAPAQAASAWWSFETHAAPTIVSPAQGSEVQLYVTAANIGNAATDGTTVTITDTLPKGLRVFEVAMKAPGAEARREHPFKCEPEPKEEPKEFTEKITCTYERALEPYEPLAIKIRARVESGVSEATGLGDNKAEIKGGGVEGKPASVKLPVSASRTQFGVENFALKAEKEGGVPDSQAGSHPYQLTTQFNLNESIASGPLGLLPALPQTLKDISVKLPAGLIGTANEHYIPRCSSLDFATTEKADTNHCPAKTAIGVAVVTINEPVGPGLVTKMVPLFNLEPAPGEPARFGFEILKVPVILDATVRTGEDYSVRVSVENASQVADVLSSTVTFWGVPSDVSHASSRGWDCLARGAWFQTEKERCTEPPPAPGAPSPPAFLSLPTQCNVGLKASALVDSWTEPGARFADGTPNAADPRWKSAEAPEIPALTGCDALPFDPSISVTPETGAANTPSGLTVNVHVPQESTIDSNTLAEAAVRTTTVTLPPGVLLSPSAANGLEACSEALTGFTGEAEFEPGVKTHTFTRYLPSEEEAAPGANICPNGSKVGEVHIKTPDLEEELVGGVYLAQQNSNPFGSLFAMYILAESKKSHVVAKLAGQIEPNPGTGQITTVFENTPQVPFENLTLKLFGGPAASVTTPPTCGTYTTTSTFVPWSTTAAHPQETHPGSSFPIGSGPGGGPCANPLPLNTSFNAGGSNLQAGGFTSFAVTLGHGDGEQVPTALNIHLPPGMAAMISSVKLCKDAQAQAGTCGPESLIGHATAVAGLGSSPFTENGGLVYITEAPKTGKYVGASFGLSVVIPTKAGPFDFGNVVTHAGLYVDPNTTAVTVASELPTMVNTVNGPTGVPVQLKQIHVVVDRPNFQFNPTNCSPGGQVGAEVIGAQGAVTRPSSPLQVANCSALPFHPELTAELNSQFDKLNGLALKIVVKSTPGQANIQKTKVVFPLQVPSRLSTIQKACPDTVFEKNPALCPEGSVIGKAIAHTPVLNSPLQGPAYLVSHGNRSFPDAEFVLQGEGITLILDGETNIHNGITSSTFNSVPDAPVTTFEVELPRGPHSAFTGYGNLCAPTTTATVKKRVTVRKHGKVTHPLRTVKQVVPQPLVLPTELGGQNGHTIDKTTPIKVTGCAGVKGSKTKKRPSKKKKKHTSAKNKKH